MKIVVLDRFSIGEDTGLEGLYRFGEVDVFDSTDPDELSDRLKGADVAILNKVKMTREALEGAKTLKLVCVFDYIGRLCTSPNGHLRREECGRAAVEILHSHC